MTANETARNYKIPATRTFGTKRKYYLDDVYKYKKDAVKRTDNLRLMRYYARIVRVLKPGAKPKTYHTAVYLAPRPRYFN